MLDACESSADCLDKLLCRAGQCVAPNCVDRLLSVAAGESDVDCGGRDSGCKPCSAQRKCTSGAQCASGLCDPSGRCSLPTQCGPDDCGGPCGPCPMSKPCAVPTDCASLVCRSNACAAPSCSDGVRNGNETGVDCGDPQFACPSCGVGAPCVTDGSCASGLCVLSRCAAADACFNRLRDSGEPDVDCGGALCGPCADGASCATDGDCQSGSGCLSGVCSSTALEVRLSLLTSGEVGVEGACDLPELSILVVVSVGPTAGPGGGGSTVSVSGSGFVAVGTSAYRLAVVAAGGGSVVSTTVHTTCLVASDSELVCSVPPGSGHATLAVEYQPFGSVVWSSVRAANPASLRYSFTYTVGAPAALSVLRSPPVVVAGHQLASVQVAVLDGSGRVATSNFHTVVTVSLSVVEQGNGTAARTLQGRGLSGAPGSCSGANTLSVVVVGGVATFTNITVDVSVAGSGYAMVFAIPGSPVVARSLPFPVFQPRPDRQPVRGWRDGWEFAVRVPLLCRVPLLWCLAVTGRLLFVCVLLADLRRVRRPGGVLQLGTRGPLRCLRRWRRGMRLAGDHTRVRECRGRVEPLRAGRCGGAGPDRGLRRGARSV